LAKRQVDPTIFSQLESSYLENLRFETLAVTIKHPSLSHTLIMFFLITLITQNHSSRRYD